MRPDIASVFLIWRRESGADRIRDHNAVGIEADVTSQQIAAAFEAFGETPDLLVNNAGIVRFGAMEAQSVQDYIDVVNVNLLGSYLCLRDRAGHDGEAQPHHQLYVYQWHSPGPRSGHVRPDQGCHGEYDAGHGHRMGSEWIRVNAIAPGMIDAGIQTDF